MQADIGISRLAIEILLHLLQCPQIQSVCIFYNSMIVSVIQTQQLYIYLHAGASLPVHFGHGLQSLQRQILERQSVHCRQNISGKSGIVCKIDGRIDGKFLYGNRHFVNGVAIIIQSQMGKHIIKIITVYQCVGICFCE